MSYVIQPISNDPIFTEVQRTVIVFGVNFNDNAKSIDLYYKIIYTKNGLDVTNDISKEVKPWVVSDAELMTVRDDQNNPVPNPNYDPEDENSSEFLKLPGHSYVMHLIKDKGINPFVFLSFHIVNEDALFGRFNR